MWPLSESKRNTELIKENNRLKQKLQIAELALEIEKVRVKKLREGEDLPIQFTPWRSQWTSNESKAAAKHTTDVRELMRQLDVIYRRLNRKSDG